MLTSNTRLAAEIRFPGQFAQASGSAARPSRMSAAMIWFAAVLGLLDSGAVAADVGSARDRMRRLNRAENAYALSAREPGPLNRSYEALTEIVRLRLETAKKVGRSPESEAVVRAMREAQKGAPAKSVAAPQYQYDATLLTIAAGLESRLYDRGGKEHWKTVPLAMPAEAAKNTYYTKDVPAHCRLGAPSSKRLFVLLNSSYSTWGRGSWTNKAIALLRAEFGDSHFVVFAGFLTPEFLKLQPVVPALGGDLPARDLHPRIKALLAQLKNQQQIPVDTEVALVGFSGGANLVISLLAEDSRRIKAGSATRPLFDRGGIAFSPILDLTTSFDVLDRSCQLLTKQGFPAKRALTTPFVANALFAWLRGYGLSNPAPYFEITRLTPEAKAKKDDVIARFYREFEIVDLATTVVARYGDLESRKPTAPATSHRSYYVDFVFPEHRSRCGLDPKLSFENYTRIEPELSAIKSAPLYLVFALDDPVLARSALFPNEPPSKRCDQVLRFTRGLPSLRVFSPHHGAHMGYMLDNQYLTAVFAALFR